MSWAIGVQNVEQGEALKALTEQRDEQNKSLHYDTKVVKQQDEVFQAIDQMLDSLTFEGKTVTVNASGHVPGEEDDYRTTSVGINIHNYQQGDAASSDLQRPLEASEEIGIAQDYADSAE